jgi:hypothetical protein
VAQENITNRKAARESRKLERQERRKERKKAKAAEFVHNQEPDVNTTEQETKESAPEIQIQTQTQVQIQAQEETSIQPDLQIKTEPEVKTAHDKVLANSPKNEPKIAEEYAYHNESKSQGNSTDSEDNSGIVIFILSVVGVFYLLKKLFYGRCPKCKKLFAMQTFNEEFMGHTKKHQEKDSNGKNYTVYYSNIKVHRCCRHCGYTDYKIEERKG